ncbi:MAG TPA: hypothetical protein VHM89_01665 [Acidimicrobiales bacterium]|nr:hypothetical protein [Acidimicrobiales bacterium]
MTPAPEGGGAGSAALSGPEPSAAPVAAAGPVARKATTPAASATAKQAPAKKAAADKVPAKKAASRKAAAREAPSPPAAPGTASPAASPPAKTRVRKARRRPWVEALGMETPTSHPVKAKLSSMLYHLPGMAFYERTRPDRCYVDAAAAEADGFTRAKR